MSNSNQVARWRNELAKTAMLGLLQAGNINHRNVSNVAETAYQIADVMMKQAYPPPVPDITQLVEMLAEARYYVISSPDPVRGGFIQEIDAALATYSNQGGCK